MAAGPSTPKKTTYVVTKNKLYIDKKTSVERGRTVDLTDGQAAPLLDRGHIAVATQPVKA